jgi:adenylate cyclase
MGANLIGYARSLTFGGEPEEAIPIFPKAIRLSPFAPNFIHYEFGGALWMAGRFEVAISANIKAIQLALDNISDHLHLTITYSMMGREKEARAEAAEVLRINPEYSVDSFAENIPYKDQVETDKVVQAMRKAGLK